MAMAEKNVPFPGEVPFVDLEAQYGHLHNEITELLGKVLKRGDFISGKQVGAFEEEFASYTGVRYGIGASSGTSALHLALLSCGIGPGDQVITVSHTFASTVAAIRYTGAQPVFVDVDPKTYCMNPKLLKDTIAPRARAILPVHIYGHPAPMGEICEYARKRGLYIIEDCAQAHGAEIGGKKVGSFGDMACFSFYPSKNLGACGDGGMVLTNDQKLAEKARRFANLGQGAKNIQEELGHNYRLQELQAAILRIRLPYLDRLNASRIVTAKKYKDLFERELGLENCGTRPRKGKNPKGSFERELGLENHGSKPKEGGDPKELILPEIAPDYRHVFHLFVVQVENRDKLADALFQQGIKTGIHYPLPVHLQKPYQDLNFGENSLPITEALAKKVLSLPIYGNIPESHLEKVAYSVKEAMKSR